MSFPAPPITTPPGQQLIWLLPTSFTAGPAVAGWENGYATANANGGNAALTFSGPLLNWTFSSTWRGFTLNQPGATINSVYAVMTSNATVNDLGFYYLAYGANLEPASDGGGFPNGSYNMGPSNSEAGYSNTTISQNIGSTLSVIENASMGVAVSCSQSGDPDHLAGPVNYVITVPFVGLAVYITPPPPINAWVHVGTSHRPSFIGN